MNGRARTDNGFSLIELLVVILIIALLAAISIPVFIKQREKAWTSQMQASLKNAAAAAESYSAGTGDGTYYTPGTTTSFDLTDLQAEGFRTTSPEIIIQELTGTDTEFCIEIYHASLGTTKPMGISNSQTAPTEGTCTGVTFTAAPW